MSRPMKLSIKLSAPAKKEANGERQGGERNADDQGGDRPAKRIKVVLGAKRDHAQTAPKELELDELGQRELEQNEERALGNEPGTSGATAMSDEYHFPAWALRMGADSGHTGTQHGFRDMSSVDQIGRLKADHELRPLFVYPDGRLVVELTSEAAVPQLGRELRQLLATAAEPSLRPELVEEWHITPNSMHAAISVGWTPQNILSSLARLSKCEPLPPTVVDFVHAATANYGRVKLVLRDQEYWVETKHQDVMEMLLSDETVRSCVSRDKPSHVSHAWMRKLVGMQSATTALAAPSNERSITIAPVTAGGEASRRRFAFVVRGPAVERIKQRCLPDGVDMPLLEEFDFSGTAEAARHRLLTSKIERGPQAVSEGDGDDSDEVEDDGSNVVAEFYLKPTTKLREYQKIALAKIFAHGVARSGIVVLPCGAGKSLCGVAIAERMKRSTLVLCINNVSVDQWHGQFKMWTKLPPGALARCTADHKESWSDEYANGGVLITTYSMIGIHDDRRNNQGLDFMNFLRQHEWGCMILDEVHVVPANTFRRVIGNVRAHMKIGLTATLVREDDKVSDLHFLIGPKLYEASWIELRDSGYIARVCCYELRCSMSGGGFLEEYSNRTTRKDGGDANGEDGKGKARGSTMGGLPFQLAAGNPYKLRALEFLINFHTKKPFVETEDNRVYFERNPKATLEVPTCVLDGSGDLEDGITDTTLGRHPEYPSSTYPVEAIKNKQRSDRVLVFSDSVYLLEEFAKALKFPYVHGKFANHEREFWLQAFRDGFYWVTKTGEQITDDDMPTDHLGNKLQGAQLRNWHSYKGNIKKTCNVLFLSKVGDVGLDLPEANVVIQFSSHGGSRRQEAQRLGRILRPKKASAVDGAVAADAFDLDGNTVALYGNCKLNALTNFGNVSAGDADDVLAPRPPPPRPDAFFYTLVSSDTHEVLHAQNRRRFLVEQGYTYKLITDVMQQHPLAMSTSVFSNIRPTKMTTDDEARDYKDHLVHSAAERAAAAAAEAANGAGSGGMAEGRAAAWSGTGGYGTQANGAAKGSASRGPRHALFRDRAREIKHRSKK